MNSRTSHAAVLNVVLVVQSVCFLLSPTVYTYFSESQLSYSRAPAWFARTAPAQFTARMFDRYNARAPKAARFKARLSCYLIDEGSSRLPGCMHALRGGQSVQGPTLLKITSGWYKASFEFSGNDECAAGDARVEVVTTGRYGRVLADFTGHIVPGTHVQLPFHLKLMDAALGFVEFTATGLDGCALLSRVDWTDAPEAGPIAR